MTACPNVSCLGSKSRLPPCVVHSCVILIFVFRGFGASGWNEQTTEIWIMQINFYPNSFYTLCKSIQILSSCEQQLEDGGNPVVSPDITVSISSFAPPSHRQTHTVHNSISPTAHTWCLSFCFCDHFRLLFFSQEAKVVTVFACRQFLPGIQF